MNVNIFASQIVGHVTNLITYNIHSNIWGYNYFNYYIFCQPSSLPLYLLDNTTVVFWAIYVYLFYVAYRRTNWLVDGESVN